MSQAAYATLIYSVGAPVVINNEPMTDLGSFVFQITDAARRLLSPDTVISCYLDAGGEVEIKQVDYFNGTVTLFSDPGDDVVLDGAFVTKALISGSKSYSFELLGDVLEDTSFNKAQGNGGYKTRCYGLNDVTISLDRYDDASHKFKEHKRNREKVYIELLPGGGPSSLKGWFVMETSSNSGEVGGLEEESLNFNLASNDNQQGAQGAIYSFT